MRDRATRPRRPETILTPCVVAIVAAATLVACGYRSDEWYLRHFHQHESDLNRIVHMSREDAHVVRIAPDFTWLDSDTRWPRPQSEIGLTPIRWDEYRQLFRKVGTDAGLNRSETPGNGLILLLPIETTGLATGGSEKGYAYTEHQPSPVVQSIDESEAQAKSMEPIFKHIKGNWYLYYMWDD